MRQAHSTKWKGSIQPRKQRKYLHNAPLHLKGDQLHIHLSKELRQKHGVRALRVRAGDTVKVLRGTHKGKEGKVESVDVRNARIHVAKVETQKLQGGSAKYPLRPSNCLLVALAADKRRLKHTPTQQSKAAVQSAQPAPKQAQPAAKKPASAAANAAARKE